jgi:hypothetical protein
VEDKFEEAPSRVELKDITMASLVEAAVVEVGTVKPVKDFNALLERGEDFNKGTQSHVCGFSFY